MLAEDERRARAASPAGGLVSTRPLPSGRGRTAAHRASRARGYVFHDPFYTMYFATADFLPSVRLTARGIWDVKRSRVLRPSRPLAARAAR